METGSVENHAAPAGRRVAESERRRQNILEAARRCFGRDGYAGATVARIAKEAGVSNGLLDQFFRNKDHLFDVVLREVLRDHLHAFFALALDHDTCKEFGAAVADQHSAAISELRLDFPNGLLDARQRIDRLLFHHANSEQCLWETLEVLHQFRQFTASSRHDAQDLEC